MENPVTSRVRSLDFVAGALLGLAILLLLRRYPGIAHDSMLYMGQGLAQRWPDVFSQDLFFIHGSQGQYSVMPWILGKLFLLAKPPTLFLWGTLASLLLFASVTWIALAALVPEKQRYWAWLGVMCLPSMYGMIHMFSYNEPFLTSRPFAEALCLFAIGMLARRRWWLFTISMVIAGTFHPLQAIGATLIIWPWAVIQDRRWLHLAWFAVPVVFLALVGIPPFAGLFHSADSAWLVDLQRSKQLFLTLWSVNDFKVLFFDGLVLSCAWRTLRGRFGAWCLAALIGLATGMVLSLVLVDRLHLILPSGLQLWRAHWLAHWFSMAAIAALLYEHVRARQDLLWLLLSLTALLAWGETAWAWLVMALMYLAWPLLPTGSRLRLERLLTWIFGLALVLLFANHATNEFHWFKEAQYRLDLYPFDRRFLVFPAVSLGLPLLGWYAWQRSRENVRLLLFGLVLCPLVVLSACVWDSRLPRQRVVEDAAFNNDVFGVSIPREAQVLWAPEYLVATWMVLGRASYFSDSQLAGQMFNRATADDGRIRDARTTPLLREIANCREHADPEGGGFECLISNETLRRTCASGQDNGPDYLVLPYKQSLRATGSWLISPTDAPEAAITFWLYDCRDILPKADWSESNAAAHPDKS